MVRKVKQAILVTQGGKVADLGIKPRCLISKAGPSFLGQLIPALGLHIKSFFLNALTLLTTSDATIFTLCGGLRPLLRKIHVPSDGQSPLLIP